MKDKNKFKGKTIKNILVEHELYNGNMEEFIINFEFQDGDTGMIVVDNFENGLECYFKLFGKEDDT